MKIVGTENTNLNKNLGPKEIGEICVQGPQVMKGYYKNPKATAEVINGNWFKTGDLGYVEEDGKIIKVEQILEKYNTIIILTYYEK